MKVTINESSILMILVGVLVLYYSTNALSSPKGSIRKVIYKQKQLGTTVGEHGGLLVSSPEVNIHTRGPEMNYQQQGILYKETGDGPRHLTLYGRQSYPGSSQWEYMVGDKSLDDVKIPLDFNKELTDGDEIAVKGFGDGYKVDLYPAEELRYLPY